MTLMFYKFTHTSQEVRDVFVLNDVIIDQLAVRLTPQGACVRVLERSAVSFTCELQ